MTSLEEPSAAAEQAFEVPPSLPRLLLLPAVLALCGLLMLVLPRRGSWLDGIPSASLYLLGGLVLLALRWRRRGQPVLLIDALGVTDCDGQRLHTWLHTAQVWVGPTPGRWIPSPFRFPTLVVWTGAGVEFGRRARYGPTAALNIAVPTGLSVDQLAAAVRRFADAPVRTGTDIELGDLSRELLGPADSPP